MKRREGSVTDLRELPKGLVGADSIVDCVPTIAVAGYTPRVSKHCTLRSIPVVPTTKGKVYLLARLVQRISHCSILLKGQLV